MSHILSLWGNHCDSQPYCLDGSKTRRTTWDLFKKSTNNVSNSSIGVGFLPLTPGFLFWGGGRPKDVGFPGTNTDSQNKCVYIIFY